MTSTSVTLSHDKAMCELARYTASRSANRKIQVGAVLRTDKSAYCAVNSEKYHAEENVLSSIKEPGTLYVYPVTPCPRCAKVIIDAGIKRVVTFYAPFEAPPQRPEQVAMANEMFARAGVEHVLIRDHDDREA